MPGQHIVQGSSDLWVESGAQAERSLNTGWILDQVLNSTGGLTTNSGPSTATAFLSTGDGTTGSGNGIWAIDRPVRVVHNGGTFYGYPSAVAYSTTTLQTTVTVGQSYGGTTALSTSSVTSAAAAALWNSPLSAGGPYWILENKYFRSRQDYFEGSGNVLPSETNVGGGAASYAAGALYRTIATSTTNPSSVSGRGGFGGLSPHQVADVRRACTVWAVSALNTSSSYPLWVTTEAVDTIPSATADHLGIRSSAGTWYFSTADGTTEETTDITSFLATSTFYATTVTFDGATARLYINGVLRAVHLTKVPRATGSLVNRVFHQTTGTVTSLLFQSYDMQIEA